MGCALNLHIWWDVAAGICRRGGDIRGVPWRDHDEYVIPAAKKSHAFTKRANHLAASAGAATRLSVGALTDRQKTPAEVGVILTFARRPAAAKAWQERRARRPGRPSAS